MPVGDIIILVLVALSVGCVAVVAVRWNRRNFRGMRRDWSAAIGAAMNGNALEITRAGRGPT